MHTNTHRAKQDEEKMNQTHTDEENDEKNVTHEWHKHTQTKKTMRKK